MERLRTAVGLYPQKRNGRLKEIAYANGHTMKAAAYNGYGQMVSKYFKTPLGHADCPLPVCSTTVREILSDRLTLPETGNILIPMRTGNSWAAEFDITVSNGIVTGENAGEFRPYSYDSEGKLTRKRVVPAAGDEQVIYYENPENENPVVKFSAGGRTVTSHSKADSFGRKVFDELQLGTDFVSKTVQLPRGTGHRRACGGRKAEIQPDDQPCEADHDVGRANARL